MKCNRLFAVVIVMTGLVGGITSLAGEEQYIGVGSIGDIGAAVEIGAAVAVGEPILKDLSIDNCRVGEIASVDLIDSLKDSGNEYWITWYIDGEEQRKDWGFYGNQLILFDVDESLAGKKMQLKIESVNGDCVAWTVEQEVLPSYSEFKRLNGKANKNGEWIINENKMRYIRKDGTYPVSSWEYIDSKWYKFDDLGYVSLGWVEDVENGKEVKRYIDKDNGMLVGWNEIDGDWYYFWELEEEGYGKLLVDVITPDQYIVDADGKWTGELSDLGASIE